MNFSAVILAGGRSRRMGTDKALIKIEGRPLLERQIETARLAGADEILISSRPDQDYSAFGHLIFYDEIPDAGPLAGIQAGLSMAKHPLLLVLAVDLLEMTPEFLAQLASTFEPEKGIIPRVDGDIQPLAAYYPRAARELAAGMLRNGHFAVRDFAQGCVDRGLAAFADFHADVATLFHNCNAPADLSCLT